MDPSMVPMGQVAGVLLALAYVSTPPTIQSLVPEDIQKREPNRACESIQNHRMASKPTTDQ